MTKMKLQIAHQVPGRIRMKVPSAKDNPELLEQIKQTFSVIPGIEQVTVNPTTGSVVLHYDTEKHDEFHGHLHHHTGGHYKPPVNEIDSLATKIEQEAEYLAEHSHTAKVVVDRISSWSEGLGSYLDSLRWQLPRLAKLRSQRARSRRPVDLEVRHLARHARHEQRDDRHEGEDAEQACHGETPYWRFTERTAGGAPSIAETCAIAMVEFACSQTLQ